MKANEVKCVKCNQVWEFMQCKPEYYLTGMNWDDQAWICYICEEKMVRLNLNKKECP